MKCSWAKKTVASLIVVTLVLTTAGFCVAEPDQAFRTEPTAASMLFDFAMVRPLGIVATALGSAFFLASLPFSALGGNTKEAFNTLVADPAKFTFKRPLGNTEY